MKNLLPIAFVALLLQSCAGILSQEPEPVSSEYFRTLGGGFYVKINQVQEMFYGVNLMAEKPLEPSNYLVVEYQNPTGGKPYTKSSLLSDIQTSDVVQNRTTYILRSPPVTGVKPHTNYLITVKLYKHRLADEPIGLHKQLVNSGYMRN